jgi:HlyD family secretion protein
MESNLNKKKGNGTTRWLIALLLVAALSTLAYTQLKGPGEGNATLSAKVETGVFEIVVEAAGEMEPKRKTKIAGPMELQAQEIWRVKINSLVPEGTVIKKGDLVAELDPSPVMEKLTKSQNELLKSESQFLQARLDTTLEMRKLRDDLSNLGLAVTEKEAQLEQSKYEPPATIKLAELDLTKARRGLVQARQAYKINQQKARAKMEEVGVAVKTSRNSLDALQGLISRMSVKAPAAGMVVYRKDYSGRRVETGSEINTWDPTVATLPDLSEMVSRTYVNETDIARVKVGQAVAIRLDAAPGKKLRGLVRSVSNIGEQRPNSEAKVFEVQIDIIDPDATLRPAMTTANTIVAARLSKKMWVPQEAVQSTPKGERYCMVREGNNWKRTVVSCGPMNENFVVIEKGLTTGQEVALSKTSEG